MRSVQSLVHRREKENAKKARWRARKKAIRLSSDEPIRGEWRGKFAFTITYQNRMTGIFHALDFYLSQKRVNSYRIMVDGKLWRKQISATEALAWLRGKLPRFAHH